MSYPEPWMWNNLKTCKATWVAAGWLLPHHARLWNLSMANYIAVLRCMYNLLYIVMDASIRHGNFKPIVALFLLN